MSKCCCSSENCCQPQPKKPINIDFLCLDTTVCADVRIFPMMMKIDFQSIKNVRKNPSGILISSGSSWLIKPFLMFGLATLFFKVIFQSFIPADLAQDFVTGAVLLGVAPCTAMVFVWSLLTKETLHIRSCRFQSMTS